jgi:hypothetical protein
MQSYKCKIVTCYLLLYFQCVLGNKYIDQLCHNKILIDIENFEYFNFSNFILLLLLLWLVFLLLLLLLLLWH